jgi:hypothetical protein
MASNNFTSSKIENNFTSEQTRFSLPVPPVKEIKQYDIPWFHWTKYQDYLNKCSQMTEEEDSDFSDAVRRGVYTGNVWVPSHIPNLGKMIDELRHDLQQGDESRRQDFENQLKVLNLSTEEMEIRRGVFERQYQDKAHRHRLVVWPPSDEERQIMEDRVKMPGQVAVPLGAPYTTAHKWVNPKRC